LVFKSTIILGLISAGGIFALMRKKWLLALIGAIAALGAWIPWLFLYWGEIYTPNDVINIYALLNLTIIPGIVAIILTVLSRKQFERK